MLLQIILTNDDANWIRLVLMHRVGNWIENFEMKVLNSDESFLFWEPLKGLSWAFDFKETYKENLKKTKVLKKIKALKNQKLKELKAFKNQKLKKTKN